MSIFLGGIGAVKQGVIKTKSKINQKNMNKALEWDAKYEVLNDARDRADNDGDERMVRKLDRQCEAAWNKYSEFKSQLPMTEQKRLEKFVYFGKYK